jgi:hypothetical protein
MSKNDVKHVQRVTRYKLTIAFEELYTQDDTQLHASANAIGDVVSAIERLLITDTSLQELLKTQNLKLNIVSPTRVPTRPDAGDARGNGSFLAEQQKDRP